MSDGLIHFLCPSCQASLNVPIQMAGVVGPCPKCSVTIRAPQTPAIPQALPTMQAVAHPQPAPPQPAPVQPMPGQTYAPPSASPAPAPSAAQAPESPNQVPLAPGYRQPTSLPDRRINPQPRERPERPVSPKIRPRRSTRDDAVRASSSSVSRRQHRHGSSSANRWVMPVFLVLTSAILVFLLVAHFQKEKPVAVNQLPVPASHGSKAASTSHVPKVEDIPPAPPIPQSQLPESPEKTVEELPPVTQADDAMKAEAVLEQFLAAGNLQERLDLITPELPAEELADTVLAGELPAVLGIQAKSPMEAKGELLTMHPFVVSMADPEDAAQPVSYLVMVHQRSGEPKVAVRPFLDMVGGQLKHFTENPSTETPVFHAVIEPFPRCFDKRIPNPGNKFAYRLRTADDGEEIASAYASKLSPLAEQLYERGSKIRWGIRIPARFVLQWNYREDPDRPFLELIKIEGLDWNG